MLYDREVVLDTLLQIRESIDHIVEWNGDVISGDSCRCSPDGMKTLAATCMLLQAIGEGVKKIDKWTDRSLLRAVCPDIEWKNIMGMRDHIAHGYFDIDADFVLDVVCNDLLVLKGAVETLISYIKNIDAPL